MKGKCVRCRIRWSQDRGLCRRCENTLIEEREKLALAQAQPHGPSPSEARPGGYGVNTHIPGLLAMSFFGVVHTRR